MTLDNSAINFSTALGGLGGSVAMTLGDYQALGICAPIFPLVGAGTIWWSRPHVTAPLPAPAQTG